MSLSVCFCVAVGGGQQLTKHDINSLPELNPPHVMPRGNVGTPLATFMDLIRACKFPSHLIKKLQLKFPNSRSAKKYGAVPFEYENQQPFNKQDHLLLSELEMKKAKRKKIDKQHVSSIMDTPVKVSDSFFIFHVKYSSTYRMMNMMLKTGNDSRLYMMMLISR